ncbi:hypothetical protein [Ulvibacter litoralis]|uniref:Lipoprotein n=1 Tax=Ulvibacter litoralis TaxID=227084 RepID=A0A1G7DMT0_9FLAO|nr:hypothetical protein [Ulvibacter litoralis]GHC42886.1 hypothetical protein GCM10008083_01390 [Ulvibacter litoralis]SDE52782.1 hypothetical protein SAMN05421855_1011072 [Ulvibacter litoralis]
MKKTIFNFMLALATTTLLVSCGSDDDNNPTAASCTDGIQNGDEEGIDCGGTACQPCLANLLSGEVATDVILDATLEYELTGAYVILDGGSLTIPAGTKIKATGGTAAYIAVAQGGQIFVNGTSSNPVVMTSGSENPAAGDWGGLVICGNAPTNKGVSVTSEVADLTYGGTNANDNSGSIRYLRVEYTGATFSNDKEFNGVSLFGVGAGTTFEYVQSFFGGDDGIEFFGGTVKGDYLVSINSGDDSIDFADGWTGTGSNWYIAGGAKAGIEGSNNGDNGNAAPVTTTTLSNITIVGPVSEGALYYKEGGGNFTINNFYTSNVDLGIKVKDTDLEAAARIENGDLDINDIQFGNVPAGFQITDYTGSNQSFYTEGVATGAGNGAASPDWAAGWTVGLDNSGPASTENLAGEVSGTVSLNADVEYLLTGSFVVLNGGVLNIPAGTTIKATGGTAAYIAVAQGGKINIEGEANNPVVMTSGSANPTAGDWGGLVLCGYAPTNKGVSVTSEVADLTYGGTDANDNSGSIRYLRVEYTGATFSNDKEFNGVSLFGIGAGTTFEYVQSLHGGDDGIEFFGGSVSGNYLVSTGSGDDSIDFADGWTGNGSYWYIKDGAKAGIEGSNNGDNGNATPVTTTTLSNITVVGPVSEGALYYKEGGGNFTVTNFYTDGIDLGVKVKDTDAEAAVRIENGDLSVNPMQFDNPLAGWMVTDYPGANQNFVVQGPTSGAGNGAAAPTWAAGWTSGL